MIPIASINLSQRSSQSGHRPVAACSLSASPEPTPSKRSRVSLRILATQVARLETEIDALNAHLAPLTSFVLPGGSPAAAALHVARTVCRRAERVIVALAQKKGESVGGDAIKFINRLSDFLFVAARFANELGAKDVLWIPGQNR